MKLGTILPLAGGVSLGYVLGAAAGRPRYDQLKHRANDLLHHPKVEQTMFDLAGHAKANTQWVPGPAAGLVDTAASWLQDRLTQPDDLNQSEATAPGAGL